MADYYKILGVPPVADEKEIRTAYRRLARQYHPDAGEGSSAESFRAVQDAYDLLSNPAKRRKYDESRARPAMRYAPRQASPSVHIDLRDVFNTGGSDSRAYAEPVTGMGRRQERTGTDPLQELLEYLLREW